MAARARAMAAGLDALGIGVGERVAMVSHNSARLLTALFGVSGSGRVLVPINFRLVAEEVALHRRALRAPGCCSSTPSSTTRWPTSSASTASSSAPRPTPR